jgi:hypothetical protein
MLQPLPALTAVKPATSRSADASGRRRGCRHKPRQAAEQRASLLRRGHVTESKTRLGGVSAGPRREAVVECTVECTAGNQLPWLGTTALHTRIRALMNLATGVRQLSGRRCDDALHVRRRVAVDALCRRLLVQRSSPPLCGGDPVARGRPLRLAALEGNFMLLCVPARHPGGVGEARASLDSANTQQRPPTKRCDGRCSVREGSCGASCQSCQRRRTSAPLLHASVPPLRRLRTQHPLRSFPVSSSRQGAA